MRSPFVALIALASLAGGGPACERDIAKHSALDRDLEVQQERYRRLGLRWNLRLATEDFACIIRSERLPEVIVAGGLRPSRERVPGAIPCDYDAVFIGAKTFIAGVDRATDRIMIKGRWSSSDDDTRRGLLEAWFRDGLTAGLEIMDAAGRAEVEAAGGAWSPVTVTAALHDLTVSGWVRWPFDGRRPRYELRRCVLTRPLVFMGCEAIARVGFD